VARVVEARQVHEADGDHELRAAQGLDGLERFAMDYVVILERGKKSCGAHVPDLPGCVAVGKTKKEALRLVRDAIELHLEGMREDGLPIPAPSSSTELVTV
jgi:predicted RNase H-like HicB family nuclease